MANPVLSAPQAFTAPGYGQQIARPMTIDDVIARTAITMLVLIASAVVTYLMLPVELLGGALIVSALVGFVTVLLVSARRRINPALVLAYAVIEGVFVGAFSTLFQGNTYDGLVPQAVLGTFAAAGCTLAAYKFLRIRVSGKVQRMIYLCTAAFAGVMLVNFVLALAGVNIGLRSGGLGLVMALLGCVLAVSNLLTDFQAIEYGIANRVDERESWRAAFGLTVTMVWLYTEILRIMEYFRR